LYKSAVYADVLLNIRLLLINFLAIP
jgi:hypothetical protein